MGKFFFIGFAHAHEERGRRITTGPDFRVTGGDKELHQKTVEIVHEVSREFKKDPPQTPGEARMIMQEAVKKIG